MDPKDSGSLAIVKQVDKVILSREELIDLLKDKGIVHKRTKEKKNNKTEIVTNEYNYIAVVDGIEEPITLGKEDYNKFLQNFRNIGGLNKEDEVRVQIEPVCTAFKLSPRVKVFDLDNSIVGFKCKLLDSEVIFNNGYLKLKKEIQNSETLEYCNKLISIFNIVNVHFDFVHDYELISFSNLTFFSDKTFTSEVVKEDIKTFHSKRALVRGAGYKIIQMDIEDLEELFITVNLIWESIKESKILSTGDIFVFLGYGRYYHFHNDFLLAFANTWMFIEATLNLMWEKMMVDNNFNSKYLHDNSRNWTLQIKIDELLLKGLIDAETAQEAQNLRSMRNKVFHVSKDVNKRKIDSKMSKDCIDLGLKLFYQHVYFIDSGYIISFNSLAQSIEKCIHQNPWFDSNQ